MATKRMILGLLGLALSPIACGGGGAVEGPIEEGPMTIRLESSAFEEGGPSPVSTPATARAPRRRSPGPGSPRGPARSS